MFLNIPGLTFGTILITLNTNRKDFMPGKFRYQLHRVMTSLAALTAATFLLGGCTALGPDFVKPQVAEETTWLEQNREISSVAPEQTAWWQIFNDPVLNTLVETAYAQNLPLQIAGLRIFEARAQLGIAVGLQYPQTQTAGGSASAVGLSENSPNFTSQADDRFKAYDAGFDAAWELDFWGRFRRGIEAADASLSASVAGTNRA
jgi:outer membrane protein TolC